MDDEKDSDGEVKGSAPEGEQEVAHDRELDLLQSELSAEKRRSGDYLSKLKYLQADFENYRKRIDREVQEVEDFSITKMIRKLLPVVDELELAIKTVAMGGKEDHLLEGLEMVHKNLISALEAEGLRRIDDVGKPFNPEFHEAFEKVEGGDHSEDRVAEVIRCGYTLKGRVLRPSLVKVALGLKQQQGHNEAVKEGGEQS